MRPLPLLILLLAIAISPELLQGQIEHDKPQWRVEAGDDVYEGKVSLVRRTGDQLRIHLVSQDAMNFAVVRNGGHQVSSVTFSLGRGPVCSLATSDPPFAVDLARAERDGSAVRSQGR